MVAIKLGNDRNLMVIKSDSGYALFTRERGFWQQSSNWYWYYGNLLRYHPEAHNAGRYRANNFRWEV